MLEFLRRRFFSSKKRNHRAPSVRLTLEEFETRYLPNAGPLFSAASQLSFGAPAHVGAFDSGFGDPSSLGQCQGGQGQTQTLVSGLTGTTGSGTAIYRTNSTTGDNSLTVSITGLAANSTFTVTSGSQTLGTINTDANGRGYFSVSNVSPALASGATITVLNSSDATVLSGTLAAFTPSSDTHLSASLSGATGTSGSAYYDANSLTGENSLKVRVSSLADNSTYTVQVGGTTVGQITTDADGDGRLSLANLSTTITSGTSITVLNSSGTTVLQGTFAADTSDHGFSGFRHFGGRGLF